MTLQLVKDLDDAPWSVQLFTNVAEHPCSCQGLLGPELCPSCKARNVVEDWLYDGKGNPFW